MRKVTLDLDDGLYFRLEMYAINRGMTTEEMLTNCIRKLGAVVHMDEILQGLEKKNAAGSLDKELAWLEYLCELESEADTSSTPCIEE